MSNGIYYAWGFVSACSGLAWVLAFLEHRKERRAKKAKDSGGTP